jgi:hypothetical protein
MKAILIISLLALCACEQPIMDKTNDQKLSELTPPIVVVSTGTFMTDCMMKVVDANGRFLSLTDNSACSVNKGDTLFNNVLNVQASVARDGE